MAKKPILEIDGARFSSLDGFYDEVSRALIPGADWGRNLNAFNDILRGGFGTPETGFVLRWKNAGLSRRRLGYKETARQLKANLKTCHPSNRNHVSGLIRDAKSGKGPTLFDQLIEIIGYHCPGGEEQEDGVDLELQE